MNEKKLQAILREFAKKRNWDQFHTLKNLAISISLEASELLEIFQWEKEKKKITDEKLLKERVSEEIADIMLYILRFADLAKLDIEEICKKKIQINEKRYPIRLSKGVSTKYSKLKFKKK